MNTEKAMGSSKTHKGMLLELPTIADVHFG